MPLSGVLVVVGGEVYVHRRCVYEHRGKLDSCEGGSSDNLQGFAATLNA